jgi:hypothetical protein
MSDTVSTILILAVVSALEGVRRLPPDAFVLRRVFGGPWRAAAPLELGREFALIAWPIPVVHAIVVRRENTGDENVGIRRHVARMRARERRTRILVRGLRAGGTLILLAVVIAVPAATLRWDVFGLVASVAILFSMCVIQALATHAALRRSGAARRAAVLASIRLVWPFSAPSAAELVQLQIIRDAPWTLVLIELLGRERYLAAMRADLYDELARGQVNPFAAAFYGHDAIAAFLRDAGETGGQPFCPRCSAQYRDGVDACANCEDVALIR